MAHQDYPTGNFRSEYVSIVRETTAGQHYRGDPAGFTRSVTDDAETEWLYQQAVSSTPVDMHRRALELAAPESFFSLYASAYYRGFTVVDVSPAESRTREAWGPWVDAMKAFPERLDFAPALQDLQDARLEPFDVAFSFRTLERLTDDFAHMDQLRAILSHNASIAFSMAFSPSAGLEFDPEKGFRVYDEARVRKLLDGFKINTWRLLESRSKVDTSPQPFDQVVLHVGARRL